MSVEEIYVNCGHENCSKAFVGKIIFNIAQIS